MWLSELPNGNNSKKYHRKLSHRQLQGCKDTWRGWSFSFPAKKCRNTPLIASQTCSFVSAKACMPSGKTAAAALAAKEVHQQWMTTALPLLPADKGMRRKEAFASLGHWTGGKENPSWFLGRHLGLLSNSDFCSVPFFFSPLYNLPFIDTWRKLRTQEENFSTRNSWTYWRCFINKMAFLCRSPCRTCSRSPFSAQSPPPLSWSSKEISLTLNDTMDFCQGKSVPPSPKRTGFVCISSCRCLRALSSLLRATA